MSSEKEKALHSFWNSFGLKAYDETTVPDDATFPRITYNVVTDSLGGVVSLHADLWYRSNSWQGVTDLSETIARRIKGKGFVSLPIEGGGYIYLSGGKPFSQRIDDPDDDSIKRIYINIQAEYLTAY